MKRFFSLIILTAMLTAVLTFATAQQTVTILKTSDVQVTLDLKTGDTAGSPTQGSGDVVRVTVKRRGCADVTISVAYADMEGTKSLGDMSASELDAYRGQLSQDYPGANIETRTTASGNLYLLADMHGDYDLHTMFTLYKGFYIELSQFNAQFAPLKQVDEDFLLDVLHGLWITGN